MTQINHTEAQLYKNIGSINTSIENSEEKITNINTSLKELNQSLEGLNKRIEKIEQKINILSPKNIVLFTVMIAFILGLGDKIRPETLKQIITLLV